MAEPSIIEKAKAYDEAIKKAETLYKASEPMSGCNVLLETLFPGLKESEDERIRKWLIYYFKEACDNVSEKEKKGVLAWLEKQCEKKHDTNCFLSWSEEDELYIRELESLVKRVWAIAEHQNDKDTIHKMSDLSFFLKTLKPQPTQEWNEEDEKYSSFICAALQCYYRLREDRNNTNGQENLDKARNWLYNKLKSLRPQNSSVTDEELEQAKKDAYNDALDKIEYHSGEPTFDDGWSAAIWYLKKRNVLH